MGQNFYSPEELDHILMEMKVHQRRDVLLCIDEILTALDATSPAVDQWKAARRSIQLTGGSQFAAMAPFDASQGKSA